MYSIILIGNIYIKVIQFSTVLYYLNNIREYLVNIEFRIQEYLIFVLVKKYVTANFTVFFINQDLSYGEILAGRPGALLVKNKNVLYA